MPRFATLVFASLFLVVVGCSHSKVSTDEPEKMDKILNSETGDRGEKVGVRGDNIVVQKRVYLEEELAKIKDNIDDLENSIYGQSLRDPGGLWLGLQDCRKHLADPRIGGNSAPEPQEKWEKISQGDPDYDYRVDNKKNVVAVSEQELGAKIANLKKTRNILERRYEEMKTKLESCQSRYQTALLQHGLNPDDTKAVGEWVDGPNGYKVWKMRKTPTHDPEELMKRKQKRDKSSEDDT
jgi:hypothetical protein